MLGVFADAGLPVHRQMTGGVVELTFPIPAGGGRPQPGRLPGLRGRPREPGGRGQPAAPAAARHRWRWWAPAGGGERVGREILHNIVTGGFTGTVYPVNPRATSLEGLPCLASVDDLPERVDLAVLAVPAAAVTDVAERCGRRGVRSLGGDHLGPGCPRPGPARGVPPARHAPGRAQLLRRGRAAARARRHVRRQPPGTRLARAWSSSPAGSGSRCSRTCRSWASACPRSPRSATSTTCPATTC